MAVLARHHRAVLADHPALAGRRLLFEVIRRMLSEQVHDVVDTTRAAIERAAPASPDAVREAPTLSAFTAETLAETRELKSFLRINLYRHPSVVEQTDMAKQVVRDLFDVYLEDPTLAPIDLGREPSRPPRRGRLPGGHDGSVRDAGACAVGWSPTGLTCGLVRRESLTPGPRQRVGGRWPVCRSR